MSAEIRIHKTTQDNFSRVPNTLLADNRLSWRAKGVAAYLCGKPTNWKIQMRDLINRSTEGRDAIYTVIGELIAAGYLRRCIERAEGNLQRTLYEFSDTADFQEAAFQDSETQDSEKPPLSKIEDTKKELTKKEQGFLPLPFALPFGTDAFRNAWGEWETHRREIRHKLTPSTRTKQLKALAKMGEARAIAAIQHSITSGYTGLFEPNGNTNKKPTHPNTRITGWGEGQSAVYAGIGKL